jgi:predicted dehydrogenase
MSQPRVRIAVVGVGHLGRHHARLLAQNPRAELVAVVDVRAEAAAKVAEQHGCEGLTDYRALFGRVDAVSVVVPTVAHREVAGEFLAAGIDVLVEKPIAPSEAEGRELVELARRHQRILQVGHVERFNPAFDALCARGIEPRYIESQRLAPFSFRSTDIGVVLDLMIHDIDLVLRLVDSPVRAVRAYGGAVFTPAEDMASATIEFENGAIAQLTASRVALKPLRKMRVFSREGYASIDFAEYSGVVIRKNPGWDVGKLDLGSVDTARIDDLWKYVFEGLLSVDRYQIGDRNPLAEELDAFLGCVVDRTEPRVTGEDGAAAVGLARQVLDAIGRHPW